MKFDWFVKLMLVLMVIFLGTLAIHQVAQPAAVQAQSTDSRQFYVEPGYAMLRKPDGTGQMYGKVMIDLHTGDIWGFPTRAESPYPIDTAKSEPPKSHPMYLGKFVLSEASR